MKILYIGPYYFNPVLDQDTVTLILKDFTDALGEKHTIYLLSGRNNENVKSIIESRYNIIFIEAGGNSYNGMSRIRYIADGIRLVFKKHIDVVTNVYGGISYGFDAAVIALVCLRRLVLRIPGNEIKTRFLIGTYRGLKGKILFLIDYIRQFLAVCKAKTVITMSPWETERIRKIAFKKSKVVMCPRGADLNLFSPAKSGKTKKEGLTILYIGRNSYEKGYDVAIETARRLEHYNDIRFIFAGNFMRREEAVLRFIGYVKPDELINLYGQVDVVLLPSRTEGFPQVICEAMSMGKPCIVSRHLFEGYFHHMEDAVLCDLDPDDIAKKILFLYNNMNLIRSIGKAGHEFVRKYLNRDEWGKIYRGIILGKPNLDKPES